MSRDFYCQSGNKKKCRSLYGQIFSTFPLRRKKYPIEPSRKFDQTTAFIGIERNLMNRMIKKIKEKLIKELRVQYKYNYSEAKSLASDIIKENCGYTLWDKYKKISHFYTDEYGKEWIKEQYGSFDFQINKYRQIIHNFRSNKWGEIEGTKKLRRLIENTKDPLEKIKLIKIFKYVPLKTELSYSILSQLIRESEDGNVISEALRTKFILFPKKTEKDIIWAIDNVEDYKISKVINEIVSMGDIKISKNIKQYQYKQLQEFINDLTSTTKEIEKPQKLKGDNESIQENIEDDNILKQIDVGLKKHHIEKIRPIDDANKDKSFTQKFTEEISFLIPETIYQIIISDRKMFNEFKKIYEENNDLAKTIINFKRRFIKRPSMNPLDRYKKLGEMIKRSKKDNVCLNKFIQYGGFALEQITTKRKIIIAALQERDKRLKPVKDVFPEAKIIGIENASAYAKEEATLDKLKSIKEQISNADGILVITSTSKISFPGLSKTICRRFLDGIESEKCKILLEKPIINMDISKKKYKKYYAPKKDLPKTKRKSRKRKYKAILKEKINSALEKLEIILKEKEESIKKEELIRPATINPIPIYLEAKPAQLSRVPPQLYPMYYDQWGSPIYFTRYSYGYQYPPYTSIPNNPIQYQVPSEPISTNQKKRVSPLK